MEAVAERGRGVYPGSGVHAGIRAVSGALVCVCVSAISNMKPRCEPGLVADNIQTITPADGYRWLTVLSILLTLCVCVFLRLSFSCHKEIRWTGRC